MRKTRDKILKIAILISMRLFMISVLVSAEPVIDGDGVAGVIAYVEAVTISGSGF